MEPPQVFQSRQVATEELRARAGSRKCKPAQADPLDAPYLLLDESVDPLQHAFTRELVRHIWLNLQERQGTVKGTRDTRHSLASTDTQFHEFHECRDAQLTFQARLGVLPLWVELSSNNSSPTPERSLGRC